MSVRKKKEVVVHCVMCGKDFRIGDSTTCGGMYNGEPICRTGDIRRDIEAKLSKKTEEAGKSKGE